MGVLWLPGTTDCYIDQLHNVFVLVVGIVVYGLLLSNIVDALIDPLHRSYLILRRELKRHVNLSFTEVLR